MIIHLQNRNKFSAIHSVKDLRKLIACPGLHWPDADVLAHASLSVARVGYFDVCYTW